MCKRAACWAAMLLLLTTSAMAQRRPGPPPSRYSYEMTVDAKSLPKGVAVRTVRVGNLTRHFIKNTGDKPLIINEIYRNKQLVSGAKLVSGQVFHYFPNGVPMAGKQHLKGWQAPFGVIKETLLRLPKEPAKIYEGRKPGLSRKLPPPETAAIPAKYDGKPHPIQVRIQYRLNPAYEKHYGLKDDKADKAAGTQRSVQQRKKRPRQKPRPKPPTPDHANVHYGKHQRQVLDLWLAKSDKPTPLVIYIHGGGFRGGSKETVAGRAIEGYRRYGISVAAINYRLTTEVPFPAAHHDSARAVQFLRHHAKKYNLDPKRFAATGGSAGGGISMWLAFHDDLADPKSDDPVTRQSTRLTCVAVSAAQSSYDPRFAKSIGLPRLEQHSFFFPFYGIKRSEFDTPKAHKLYEEASAITHLTKDDVPVYATYGGTNEPITDKTTVGTIVHHPKFGIALKERMDKLGIECIVRYRGQRDPPRESSIGFMLRHLKVNADRKKKRRKE